MKNFILPILIFAAALLTYVPVQSQSGSCDPDSLVEVTIVGTIEVQIQGTNELYSLVTDNETFRLNFGPWWYFPSEGTATRPEDGDSAEIYGGLNPANAGIVSPVIIVYEIDGEFWRNPYEPIWNNFNNTFSSDPTSYGNGTACGWPDSDIVTELYTGNVVVDTTLVYAHYFLDTDYDGIPDYRLNFGPPWYEPIDSVLLPEEGDSISVIGAIVHTNVYPIIIVFAINDQVWRDEEGFGADRFGKWMHGNKNNALTISSPFDTLSRIRFHEKWHRGEMPGSMFCQLLEVHHQNTFNHFEHKTFAAFELSFMNQQRHNMMYDNQNRHGMRINSNAHLQFHYRDTQRVRAHVNAHEQIHLLYWDEETDSWLEQTGVTVDTVNALVSFETETLRPFYILTSTESTSATRERTESLFEGVLRPNPARGATSLGFSMPHSGHTTIALYSGNGQQVRMVLNSHLPMGRHEMSLPVHELIDGIYYVVITSEAFNQTLPLVVLQ